jgi:hypothetical protein
MLESQKKAIKKYYESHKEEILEKTRNKLRERYANDPEYRQYQINKAKERYNAKKAQQNN